MLLDPFRYFLPLSVVNIHHSFPLDHHEVILQFAFVLAPLARFYRQKHHSVPEYYILGSPWPFYRLLPHPIARR
ncbi:unnamed protein product [Pseudo-nitzschia multistriata]|uniref:Uncharacterized protein n=1 Tax=Pseudo-nitzschia multistriata TaxID=183589 RepID=A0A448ZGD5_9STRA|nr:unnamed protein product [Pseudo-nitzschia multistriata]